MRDDSYYDSYVIRHNNYSKQQDDSFEQLDVFKIIDCIAKKAKNLKDYVDRVSHKLTKYDFNQIEKIIKNDEVMLKYLDCELHSKRYPEKLELYQDSLSIFNNLRDAISYSREPMNISSEPINNRSDKKNFDPSVDFNQFR